MQIDHYARGTATWRGNQPPLLPERLIGFCSTYNKSDEARYPKGFHVFPEFCERGSLGEKTLLELPRQLTRDPD
jgi:hypothetical protein